MPKDGTNCFLGSCARRWFSLRTRLLYFSHVAHYVFTQECECELPAPVKTTAVGARGIDEHDRPYGAVRRQSGCAKLAAFHDKDSASAKMFLSKRGALEIFTSEFCMPKNACDSVSHAHSGV